MWYRYFRCGIGIFPLRAFSDTTSEIISNRVIKLLKKIKIGKKIGIWVGYDLLSLFWRVWRWIATRNVKPLEKSKSAMSKFYLWRGF